MREVKRIIFSQKEREIGGEKIEIDVRKSIESIELKYVMDDRQGTEYP